MTVKELISELLNHPMDWKVHTNDVDHGINDNPVLEIVQPRPDDPLCKPILMLW